LRKNKKSGKQVRLRRSYASALWSNLFAGFLMVRAKFNTESKSSYSPAFLPIRCRIQRPRAIWLYSVHYGRRGSFTRSSATVTALPLTVTSISAPHLEQTMMLFVPDADLLTRCPQLQQWVISISLFVVILHDLLHHGQDFGLLELIAETDQEKRHYESDSKILVPVIVSDAE
jgi:hypothetical protein